MATIKEWIRDFKKLTKWGKFGIILTIIFGIITLISVIPPQSQKPPTNPNPQPNITPTEPSVEIPNIIIESLKPRQEVYKIGDIARVDFVINNTLNAPYKFKLYWISNYETSEGWSAISTDIYPIDTKLNKWGAYFPDLDSGGLLWKGNWTVNLTINYNCQGKVCFGSKSRVTEFNVTKV